MSGQPPASEADSADPSPHRSPESRRQAALSVLQSFVDVEDEVLAFGCADLGPAPSESRFRRFLAQGHQAGMSYLERQVEERLDPRKLTPWAESLILFALKPSAPMLPYSPPGKRGLTPSASPPDFSGSKRYRIAAYAQGEDYHFRARRLLQKLEALLLSACGPVRLRPFVDTSPVFERDFAAAAGLGWRAKNCTLLSRDLGSHFLLMGLLIDIALPTATPVQEFCGGCTRCLDACPTQAFTAPGELDARKCISYWTIEHRGALPEPLAQNFGEWIFGCDICQAVCPWNRKHLANETTANPHFQLSGAEWLDVLRPGGGFQSRFKHSPLSRAGRKGLLRNVANAASNQGDASMLPQLAALAEQEEDAMLREACVRSLAKLKLGEGGIQTKPPV